MKKILLLLFLVATAAFLLFRAFEESQEIQRVAQLCELAASGQPERALAESQNWQALKYDQENAVVCRALALLETQQPAACGALVWEASTQHLPDHWLPPPRAALAFLDWAVEDQHGELVNRIQNQSRGDLPTQKAALGFWTRLGAKAKALQDIFAKHPSGAPSHLAVRLWVGNQWLKNNENPLALKAIESIKDIPKTAKLKEEYYDLRLRTWGALGDGPQVLSTAAQWQEQGGPAADVRAKTALIMNAQKLKAPNYSSVNELHDSVANLHQIKDVAIQKNVATRLMVFYTSEKAYDEAQKLYDSLPARLDLPAPKELAPQMNIPSDLKSQGQWTVSFVSELTQSITLNVSPEDEENFPLGQYRQVMLAPGAKQNVQTTLSRRPLRWVAKSEGQVIQAGTLWPGTAEVKLTPKNTTQLQTAKPVANQNAANDQIKKLITLFLDCADWHLIQYGRQLGLLPNFEKLITQGFSGVMLSQPPITAMAMEKLVWPERRLQPSVQSHLYQMGAEIGGLASVGKNPLEALQFFLPQSRNFFDVMGAGEHSIANMLFSHGALAGGRNALLTGPGGHQKQLRIRAGLRPLTDPETKAFPGLAYLDKKHQQEQLQMMAAQMDMVEHFYGQAHPHLMMMRIESLDILTHDLFKTSFKTGVDNGDLPLLWVYRYLDHRLGDIIAKLQPEDLLMVYSDHGIETATKHHEVSFFSLYGHRVKAGRLKDQPEFSGLPHLMAKLMGEEASFPQQDLAKQVLGQVQP